MSKQGNVGTREESVEREDSEKSGTGQSCVEKLRCNTVMSPSLISALGRRPSSHTCCCSVGIEGCCLSVNGSD